MTKLLGNVDLLGLNEYGRNPGMNPLWGVMIGGSVSGLTSAALSRGTGKAAAHSDLIGLLAGIATGGVMWSMRSTRHAAFGAFAGAFFASGLKWLENTLFGAAPHAAAMPPGAGTKGIGLPMMQPLNGGLGLPMMQPLNGQMGLPSISPSIPPRGAIPGVAGPQVNGGFGAGPPAALLGNVGLSARYGATLLGGR